MTPDDLPENWRRKITVSPDGCWIWSGAAVGQSRSYANVRIASKLTYLHKHLFLQLYPEFAEVSDPPRLVRECATPLCVNPHHWAPFVADPNHPHPLIGRPRKCS